MVQCHRVMFGRQRSGRLGQGRREVSNRGGDCDEICQFDQAVAGFSSGCADSRGASALVWVNASAPANPAFGQQAGEIPKVISTAAEAAMPKVSDLVVHEWGTFLGMSSADGTALDGMYHEEHALPAFVHGRSRDQLKLPQMLLKGETPVIYFYTKEKQNVRVGVGFPQGIWTQWYPQAAVVLPSLETQAEQSGELKGGRICWYAEVIPRWAMPHDIEQADRG